MVSRVVTCSWVDGEGHMTLEKKQKIAAKELYNTPKEL
jgi:hypothetical protein